MDTHIPAEEQMEAILNGRCLTLAAKHIPQGCTLREYKFSDFITVCFEDFRNYARSRLPEFVSFDHICEGCCIMKENERFKLLLVERGRVEKEEFFESVEDAQNALLQKLWKTAKIHLNHQYRNARPDLKEVDLEYI